MEWLEQLIKTQNYITMILAFLLLLWLLSSIIRNLTTIFDGVENGYNALLKLLKWILNVLLLPFKLVFKFFKWIISFKARINHIKSVLNSIYNVNPGNFKIPWWRLMLSKKIRREAMTRFRCIERCIETQEFFNKKLKYITMIETSVGGGKSSLMAGITHYKALHFQEMIKEKISYTQKILYYLDWNKIDSIIKDTYKRDTKINHIVNKILEDAELSDSFKGFYNNYRQDVPLMTILKDYVTAVCALERNNYVMANYRIFNRVTKSFNIDLPPNLFDIKTAEGQANYYIPSYCIIAADEISLSNLKNTSSYYEIDSAGVDTALRLFRQLKCETTFYVSCSQIISRNAKIFTELANSYFKIISLEVVGVQKTYSRIFQNQEKELKEKLAIETNPDEALNIKKQMFELFQEQNKIYAAGYLKYKIYVATNIKDFDRFDKSSLEVQEVYIPMTWAFGTYLTCQFAEFDDYLTNKSGKSDSELKIIVSFFESTDPIVFENMLKNREEEKRKKEEEEKRLKEEAKAKKKEEKKGDENNGKNNK